MRRCQGVSPSVGGLTMTRFVAVLLCLLMMPFALPSAQADPPWNDQQQAFAYVTSNQFHVTVDTTEATLDPGEPRACGGHIGNTVWYSFTPLEYGSVVLNTFGSSFDTVMGVYIGYDYEIDFQYVTCNDDAPGSAQSRLEFAMIPNKVYQFQLGGADGASGILEFDFAFTPAPANDLPENAERIPALPFGITANNFGATHRLEDRTCGSPRATLWYRYKPSVGGTIVADTFGSDVDTTLAVYVEGTSDFPTAICNDDWLQDKQSRVAFEAAARTTYLFQVGSATGKTGNLHLNVDCLPDCDPLPNHPPGNDDLRDATILRGFGGTDSVDTTLATTEALEPQPSCVASDATGAAAPLPTPVQATAWYAYDVLANGEMVIEASGLDQTVLTAYNDTLLLAGDVACVSTTGPARLVFNATAGETLWVQVATLLPAGGPTEFSLALTPFVPNDAIALASVVTSLPYTDSQNVRLASEEDGEGWCSYTHSIWYRYTAPHDLTLLASVAGESAHSVAIHLAEDDRPARSYVDCRASTVASTDPVRVSTRAEAGQTYFIRAAAGASPGILHVGLEELPLPTNDEPASATDLATLPATGWLSNRGANDDADAVPGTCGSTGTDNSVWYKYTASTPLRALLSVAAFQSTTRLETYRIVDGVREPVDCLYYYTGDIAVGIGLEAGETGYFRLTSYRESDFSYTFEVRDPLPHDDFADAKVIGSVPYHDDTDTFTAGAQDGEAGASSQRTIWYAFTPDAAAPYRLSIGGYDGFKVASVYTGSALDQLTYLGRGTGYGEAKIDLAVQPGTTYYFQIQTRRGEPADLTVDLFELVPPANDAFAQATPLSLPVAFIAGPSLPTEEAGEPLPCGDMSRTQWFRFDAAATQPLSIHTLGSDYDTVLAIYEDTTGGTVGDLSLIGCNDDDYGTRQSQVHLDAVAGHTYYFQVGGWEGQYGRLVLTSDETVVPNDDFEDALEAVGPAFSHEVDLRTASAQAGESASCTGAYDFGHTVWYRFTAPSDGVLAVDTGDSGHRAARAVYQGPGLTDLTELACSRYYWHEVEVPVSQGETYYIQFGETNRRATSMTALIDFVVAPPNDNFDQAIPVAGPATLLADTRAATFQAGEPRECGGIQNTVWYAFTPTQPGYYRLNTEDSDFETVVSVSTGPSMRYQYNLGCDRGAAEPLRGKLDFLASPGVTYYIQAGGRQGDTGLLVLDVSIPSDPQVFDGVFE